MATRNVDVITVIIVDDHSVVRRGMRAFLDMIDDIEVIGEAVDGQDALSQLASLVVAQGLPDVMLMDLNMPKLDGVTATVEIKKLYPSIGVVALTSFSEAARVRAALDAGVDGYLLKDAEADEVAVAVRAASRGEIHLDPAIARILTRRTSHQQEAEALTSREREVLILLAQGKSNREIASNLVVSERTARTHVSHILLKLNLASRTQAALWAIHEGLLPTT